MLAPDGQMLCRTSLDRLEWYLKRGLAVSVSDQIYPTIKLKNNPTGRRGADDPYNLEVKENICVVCGCREGLTKHHIVPYVYRKEFPLDYKQHSCYDIVLLCRIHHNEYENFAYLKKLALGKRHNAPLSQVKAIGKDYIRALKSAASLHRHSSVIPNDRIIVLKGFIAKYLEKNIEDISSMDIENLCKREKEKYLGKTHGPKVVSEVVKNKSGLHGFIVSWRKHFVKHCKPRFLSSLWKVNKRII